MLEEKKESVADEKKVSLVTDILDKENYFLLAKKYESVFKKLFLCPEEKRKFAQGYLKAASKTFKDRRYIGMFKCEILMFQEGIETIFPTENINPITFFKDKWVFCPIINVARHNPYDLIMDTIPAGLLSNGFLREFCDKKYEKKEIESKLNEERPIFTKTICQFYYYFNQQNQLVFSITYFPHINHSISTITKDFKSFEDFFNFLRESYACNRVCITSKQAEYHVEDLLHFFYIQTINLVDDNNPKVAQELTRCLKQNLQNFPVLEPPILIRTLGQCYLYAYSDKSWSLIPIENEYLFNFLWQCKSKPVNQAKPGKSSPGKTFLIYGNELSLLSDILKTYHLYDVDHMRKTLLNTSSHLLQTLDKEEISSKYEGEIKKPEKDRNLPILEQVCASVGHYPFADDARRAVYFSTAASFDKVGKPEKAFIYFLMAVECATTTDPKYARHLANCHYQLLVKHQKILQEIDLTIIQASIKSNLILPLVIIQLISEYAIPVSEVLIYRAVRKKGLFSQNICQNIPALMRGSRPSGSHQVIIDCRSEEKEEINADLIYEYAALFNKFFKEMHCSAQAQCGKGQIIISGIGHKDLIKMVAEFKPQTNASNQQYSR